MRQTPLQLEFRTIANGSGIATIEKGPEMPGQRWNLSTASVRSTSVEESTCEVFMGQTQVDGTYSGNLDSTDQVTGLPLYNGQKVRAQWTGCDPGATCTLAITGTIDTDYR